MAIQKTAFRCSRYFYLFKHLISNRKHTKNEARSKIFDEHFENSLRIPLSQISTDLCLKNNDKLITIIFYCSYFYNKKVKVTKLHFLSILRTYSTFFCSSAIISVRVFYVLPKTAHILPMWPRKATRFGHPCTRYYH